MNIKHILFVLLCFGANCALAQDAQTPYDEESARDLLLTDLRKQLENIPVAVLFFDINHDGILDALVSEQRDTDSGGCHGNDWSLYRFEKGEWRQSPYKMVENDESTFDSSNDVWARGDDFFRMTEDGQNPKLVLIYSSSIRKNMAEYTDTACEITIDSEGYLKTIHIPELSGERCGIGEEMEEPGYVPPLPEEKPYKLEPLGIIALYPTEQQKRDYELRRQEEEEKWAEAKVATASSPLDNEESNNVEQGSPSFRGAYINLFGQVKNLSYVLIPVICAVLYFVWRKLKTNTDN